MIKENAQKILNELPDGVELVAAAKQRKPEEIMENPRARSAKMRVAEKL